MTNLHSENQYNTTFFLKYFPSMLLFSFCIPINIPVGSIVLMPHRILLLIMFFPLLIRFFHDPAYKFILIDYLLIFSVLWSSISIVISDGNGMIEALGIFWLEFLGAYLVGRICIRSNSDFLRLVTFYLFLVVFLLPFSIVESVLHRPIYLELMPNSINPIYTQDRWGLRRAQTAFAHPILFGVFASSAFGLSIFIFRRFIFKFTAIFAILVNTILSLSTGALLSVTMQLAFIVWEVSTRPHHLRWWGFGALAVMFYISIDLLSNPTPFHLLVTYASFNSDSAYSRILIWEWGMQNVAQHPWFGLGLDVENWERPYWKSGSADNYWLLTAMTYGIPAVISYAVAIITLMVQIARSNINNKSLSACRSGFLTSMGGIVIAGGTVHYWHAMQAFVMFFMASGIWLIWNIETAETTQKVSESEKRGVQYSRFNRSSSSPSMGYKPRP